MRNASKTMYEIARIFTFVLLGLVALLITLETIFMIVDIVKDNPFAGHITKIVGYSVWFVFICVMIILASKAIKDIVKNEKENSPHIIMIVAGAISGNVFYLLGGIFGLIAIGQENESK